MQRIINKFGSCSSIMHKRCRNTELFLVRIFLYYPIFRIISFPVLPVFSCIFLYYFLCCPYYPNTGKYRLEKTPYLNTFHAVVVTLKTIINNKKWKNVWILLFLSSSRWTLWRIFFGNPRDNMDSFLYLPTVVVTNVDYIKRTIHKAIHKSTCN